MSLLNVWIQPHEATIAVDTDAVSEDGRHFQTSKLFVLASINAIFAARGESMFHDCLSWQCHIFKPQSFDDLVDSLPQIIASVERVAGPHVGVFDERFVNRGNEIVFVGWSHRRSRMLAWLFRKVDDMDEWQDGEVDYFHAPPSATFKGIANKPESVERIAAAQVKHMRETCGYGGGTLLVCHITENGHSLTHALRFPEQLQAEAA